MLTFKTMEVLVMARRVKYCKSCETELIVEPMKLTVDENAFRAVIFS
jgi:hypothetical protein